MIKMQNAILRNMNRVLSYKLAFSKLKANALQQSQPSAGNGPQSTNITNKALYLDYVEQVLKNKEMELVKLEQEIALKENELYQEDFRKGTGLLIVQIESIKLMEKKLRTVQEKMGIRDEEYLVLYRKFQADCVKCKNEMEDAFKKQYADLINERKLLRNKLSQFAELESYQKYLNELHEALEAKSQELAQRESMLSQGEHELQNLHSEYETQGKQTLQSQTSNRKRIKIFNTKLHSSEAAQHHNETFAKWQQSEKPNSGTKVLDNINDSSAILGEDSKQDIGYYERMDGSKEEGYRSQGYHREFGSGIKQRLNQTVDTSVQVDSENLSEASDRLKKGSVLLKFAKKWMKHTFDSNRTSITKKKLMAVNLWKMNACFDQGICQSAIGSLQAMENVWRKQEKLLYSSKMFPYNQLSLKRRKYAELMFDLSQKIFHRKKVESLLTSILTQRNRKQRLIFYLYFCRFLKNSFTQVKSVRVKDKSKLGLTVGTASGSGIGNRSDLISMGSSHILHEEHINLPHKKSTSSLAVNKSQQISKTPSVQRISNGNHTANKENQGRKAEQEKEKMKEVLAEKERTQKLLAAQCVKLEGLIKMCLVLSESTFKTTNYAMRRLTEKECQDRINVLETQLKGLQFKFDLMMTKCKLGLANNSNKISTLENLLEFTNIIK